MIKIRIREINKHDFLRSYNTYSDICKMCAKYSLISEIWSNICEIHVFCDRPVPSHFLPPLSCIKPTDMICKNLNRFLVIEIKKENYWIHATSNTNTKSLRELNSRAQKTNKPTRFSWVHIIIRQRNYSRRKTTTDSRAEWTVENYAKRRRWFSLEQHKTKRKLLWTARNICCKYIFHKLVF